MSQPEIKSGPTLAPSENFAYPPAVTPHAVSIEDRCSTPSVLANKQKSSIKTTEDDHIQWSRSKKNGGYAITRVKISKDLKPWIYDFILQEFPTYREWYGGFCKIIGKKANIPELSPMSFRHTFGYNLDEMGFTQSEIQSLMNCSLPVLMRYTKRQEREIDKKFENGGW